jgi:uncharacterized protein (DUF697 family)/tellurite resistance protein
MNATLEPSTLTYSEREALFTVCLLAAFADGAKDEHERAELQRLVQSLPDGELHAAKALNNVMFKKVDLKEVTTLLTTAEARSRASEMALCICEADGRITLREHEFLSKLINALGLPASTFAGLLAQADAVSMSPLADSMVAAPPVAVPAVAGVKAAETDKMILNYSILNGALELLPETMATIGIVPLQMKMVYRIGKNHGHELDRGHIKELLAAAGVGLSSQIIEGYARKLVGGLLGRFGGGKTLRTVTNQVTSSAMSFASTYALGQLAKRYYAGGRTLSTAQLKDMFTSLTSEARGLHDRYAGEIKQKAGQVSFSQLLPLLRGQSADVANGPITSAPWR